MSSNIANLQTGTTQVFGEMAGMIDKDKSASISKQEAQEMMKCSGFHQPGLNCLFSIMDDLDGETDDEVDAATFVPTWVSYFTDEAAKMDGIKNGLKKMGSGTTATSGASSSASSPVYDLPKLTLR